MRAIDLIDKLSNSAVLNELESKLPQIFCIDCGKKIEVEQLNKKHPKAKFTSFMKCLKSCKNIVEDSSLSTSFN